MKKIPHSCTHYTVLGTLVVSFLLTGCIDKSDIDRFTEKGEETSNEGLNVSVVDPIERDYSEIKEKGSLQVITNYSSNTYFLYQGLEWGFEYELVREFAKEHDLALEVTIVGPDENPYDLLNKGEGDVIAANYTVTPERLQYVNFTRPYNLVNQLVVYSSDIENPPQTLDELAERDISIAIRRNSSYYNRVKELQKQGYELDIHLVSDEMDTESLLFEISRGTYDATIADDNMYRAASAYNKGLLKGPVIAENDSIAWAVRKNAPDLESKLNQYLYKHFRLSGNDREPKRSTFLNVIRKRYFEGGPQIADYYTPENTADPKDVISPYDGLIKSVADSAGLDWLMISAMVAQETKFNPNSQSWAGAVGLMQVMPRFSEVRDVEMLYDVQTNVREGVRIISEHLDHYSYMDSTNQWAFALATYNAGPGTLADARRLTIDRNKNPNEWEHVSESLLKLMNRQYYKDARYGFARGIETVRYVKEIMNRHKTYERIVALREDRDSRRAGPSVLGVFN